VESGLRKEIAKQKLLARAQRHNCIFMYWTAVALLLCAYITSDALNFLDSDKWWVPMLAVVSFNFVIPLLCLAAIHGSGKEVARCPSCGESWMQWGVLDQSVDDWETCEKCDLRIADVNAGKGSAL